MRKLTKMMLLVAAVFMVNFASAQDDKAISFSELPAKAQEFVKNYFSEAEITSVWKDTELLSVEDYSVVLNNGTEIEFYPNGGWKKVETRGSVIPAKIIPSGISEYLNKHYPNTSVKEIKKKKRGYEVELSNGLDLEFNSNGKFLRVDD
ncbi:MAG: PepSY-like domain-containing protein [Capnocytophaga sp.]|nr:PepSY-like domain-containing protein [Capnocytophaga sp.]